MCIIQLRIATAGGCGVEFRSGLLSWWSLRWRSFWGAERTGSIVNNKWTDPELSSACWELMFFQISRHYVSSIFLFWYHGGCLAFVFAQKTAFKVWNCCVPCPVLMHLNRFDLVSSAPISYVELAIALNCNEMTTTIAWDHWAIFTLSGRNGSIILSFIGFGISGFDLISALHVIFKYLLPVLWHIFAEVSLLSVGTPKMKDCYEP